MYDTSLQFWIVSGVLTANHTNLKSVIIDKSDFGMQSTASVASGESRCQIVKRLWRDCPYPIVDEKAYRRYEPAFSASQQLGQTLFGDTIAANENMGRASLLKNIKAKLYKVKSSIGIKMLIHPPGQYVPVV